MKKSYTLFTGLVLLAASLVFTGCENFLSGNNLKKDIEKKINYANSSTVSIVLKADKGFVSMDSLNKLKVTDSFNVTYTEGNSGYQFVKWIAEPSDAVSFDDVNDAQTKVTVEKFVDEIKIKPFCYERPIVLDKLPVNQPGGVEKNSTIYITFSKKLSDQNDLSRISVTMNDENLLSSEGIENVFKIPSLHDNEITILADRNNLLDISATSKIKVVIPGDFYYVPAEDYKICIGNDFIYEYTINKSTLEKTEIYFSCTNGEITPAATKYFSIGESFEVNYKANDGYQFTNWNITAGSSDVTIEPDVNNENKQYCSIDGNIVFEITEPDEIESIVLENKNIHKLTIKVLDDTAGINIRADGVLIPNIIGFEPKYINSGVNCDSPIEMTFNSKIGIDSFRFFDNEIPSDAVKLLDSNNLCYGYKMDDKVVFKNLLFTDLLTGLDVTNCFGIPELSDDNTMLTIVPLYDSNLMERGTTESKIIQVSVNTDGSVVDLNGVTSKNIYTAKYRINSNREKQPPIVENTYFASTKENLLKAKNGENTVLSDKDWHDWIEKDDAYYTNHASKVHLYVKGTDENSQLYKIRVTESQYLILEEGYKNPTLLSIPQVIEKYAEGEFNSIGMGKWEGDFVYLLESSKDGIVKLDFFVEDYNCNSTYLNTYWINKDTVFTKSTGDIFALSEKSITAYGTSTLYTKNSSADNILGNINYGDIRETSVKSVKNTIFWFANLSDMWYVDEGDRAYSSSYGYDFEYEVKWSTDREELEKNDCYTSGRLKRDDCLVNYTAQNTGAFDSSSNLQFFYTIPYLDETKDYYLKIIAYDQADNSRSLYGVKLKAPELIKADFDGDILNVTLNSSDCLLPGYTQKYYVYYSKNNYDGLIFSSAKLADGSSDGSYEPTFSVRIPSDNFYNGQNKVEFFVKSLIEYDISAYNQSLGGYKQYYSSQVNKYATEKNNLIVDNSIKLPEVSTSFKSKGLMSGKYDLIVNVDENDFDNLYIQCDKQTTGDKQYSGFSKGSKSLNTVVDVDVLYNQIYTILLIGEKNGKIKTSDPLFVDTSDILYNKVPVFDASYFTIDGTGDYLILNAPESKAEINDSSIKCYYCEYSYSGINNDLYNSYDHSDANYAIKLSEQDTLTKERIKTFTVLPAYYYSNTDKTKVKIPIRTLPNKDYVICLEATDVFGNTNSSAIIYFKKSKFSTLTQPVIDNDSITMPDSSKIYHSNATLQVYDVNNKVWKKVFGDVPVYTGTTKSTEKQQLVYSEIPNSKGVEPVTTKNDSYYNKFYKFYYHSNSGLATSYYWNDRLKHPVTDDYGALLSHEDGTNTITCSQYSQTVTPYYFYASGSSFSITSCIAKELKEGLGALFEYYTSTFDGNISEKDVVLYVDQPVLVQTLVSDNNWTDKSVSADMNAVLWDQHVYEEDVKNTKILTPSKIGDSEQLLYTVDISDIPSGKYYVIVAHFADGTSAVSEVRIR